MQRSPQRTPASCWTARRQLLDALSLQPPVRNTRSPPQCPPIPAPKHMSAHQLALEQISSLQEVLIYCRPCMSQTGELLSTVWALTLRSAPFPPREPISASATEGPRPGASAGCHLPQAVSVAATSTPACALQSMPFGILGLRFGEVMAAHQRGPKNGPTTNQPRSFKSERKAVLEGA